MTDNGAAYGYALSLATGQGFGLSVKKLFNVKDLRSLFNPAVNFLFGEFPDLETKAML
jgi:hypothetical protein